MSKILLVTDSNFVNNINEFRGRKISNLEVKSCQTRRLALQELAGPEEGIVVIACLDMIAADVANNVKDIATSWMYKYEASYSGTWAKENGIHKILPLYDNDRRVAALSGTHASAHERALAFDASRAKAKAVPDLA